MRKLPVLVYLWSSMSCTVLAAASPLFDPATIPAATLDKQVQSALAAPIVDITRKVRPSPTGDAHDYVSYGRYFWPDPKKPDGLPYIQEDGHPNEAQIALGDERLLGALIKNVRALAAGWVVHQHEDCARRAAAWSHVWFVAPATRLNPAFEYAQIQLGRNQNHGSPFGLIDTRGLAGLAAAVQSLHGAPGFGPEEEAAVRIWFASYLHWLTTSPNGRRAHEAKNNHGSWYLVQAIAIAQYLGRDDAARAFAREDLARIDWQIEPDGRQPLEIRRTDGLSYSLFNLEAQMDVAELAAPLGIDLWDYEAPRGGSLKKALAYLQPFDAAPEKWPHNQRAKREPGFLKPFHAMAARLDRADTFR